MTYQAVVDMQFNAILDQAPDVATWAAVGLSQGQARAEMRDNYKIAEKETGVATDFSDVPNILCEPDEYRRVKLGEGNRRALCAGGADDEPTRAPLRRIPWRRIRQRSPRVGRIRLLTYRMHLRVQREIALGDTIVFAKGDRHWVPTRHSYPDIINAET
jgi:hypothetical protein